MNYLISGLAKSGTTILFSRVQKALPKDTDTYFEPAAEGELNAICDNRAASNTLTKVLIGRVDATNTSLKRFDRHIAIYRDPRDQFISMLLYLFYDFQLSGDSKAFNLAVQALEKKVADPAGESAIELYDLVAKLVGRAPFIVFSKLHEVQRAYFDALKPHKVSYEDFVDGDMTSLEDYLSLNLALPAQVAPEYQRVARSRGYGEWRNWLTQADINVIHQQWAETLSALNYPLGSQQQEMTISPSISLEYVKQFDPAAQGRK